MKMKKRLLYFCFCLMTLPVMTTFAQGPPPGGPPGGPPGRPGGPGGPGGMPPQGAVRGANPSASASAQHNALQFGPVGRWWDDRSVMKQIGLSQDQKKRMDSVFDASKPAILASYKAFLKAQDNLTAVNKNTSADKATVFAAIDAVNSARSDLQKTTSAMLLEIRKEMDANQIKKLEKLQ